jgi:predicted RNase H-like HicB family nuclease
MSSIVDDYHFRVDWSEDDWKFIGLCEEFPGMSWAASTEDRAMEGIRRLIESTVEDMERHGETIPAPKSVR